MRVFFAITFAIFVMGTSAKADEGFDFGGADFAAYGYDADDFADYDFGNFDDCAVVCEI